YERVPELRALLRRGKLVRRHDLINALVHARLGRLDRDRVRMGVRDDRERLARSASGRNERRRTRQVADAMTVAAFQRDDVEAELCAPVLDAIPLELADAARVAGRDVAARLCEADAGALRIAFRHEFEPEKVVERQIE